jgi:cation:H+ antiporter
MIWVSLFYFILSSAVLVLSSATLLRCIEVVSLRLRLKLFIMSFFVLGLGTSLPELFVGISSALMGNPEMSFSNIIGSNLIDVTIVLGIPILALRGIRVESKEERKDMFYMFACLLLPLVFLFTGGRITRGEGISLICAFLVYNYFLLREEREFSRTVSGRTHHIAWYLAGGLASVALLYFSSRWVVSSAISLAESLGLSTLLIGLIIISIGTALPELVVGIQTLMAKEKELMVGNIIGALVAKSTLIMGIVAVIHPISIPFMHILLPSIFLLFAVMVFMAFAERGRVISQAQGLAMVMLYIVFLIVQLAPSGLRG